MAYEKELKIAREAAKKAGKFLHRAQAAREVVKQPHREGFLDVTTKQDLEAERIVLSAIERVFPQDRILSEETHAELSAGEGRLWIVDPLDGTTNYVKGLGLYGVSVALFAEGTVQMAVVYLPETDELFEAVRGGGMRRNGRPLAIAGAEESLAQSLVSVGFPHKREPQIISDAFSLYAALLSASSDLRRSASAVVDACWLASGKTGAYVTPDIKPWDIAAGMLFIEEQGGIATDFADNPLDLFTRDGDRFSTSVVFAKNAAVHAAVVAVTKNHAH